MNFNVVMDCVDKPKKMANNISSENLKDVVGHVNNNIEAESLVYTTAINWAREYAREEFELVKKHYAKEGVAFSLYAY